MNSYNFEYYAQVENVVCDILNNLGYMAMQDLSAPGSAGWLVAFDGDKRYNVYLQISREWRFKDQTVLTRMHKNVRDREIQVFVGVISDEMHEKLLQDYPDVIVLDIRNLLYLVQNDEELHRKLVAVLDFSVDELEPLRPISHVRIPSQVSKSNYSASLRSKLAAWNPSMMSSAEYERICCDTLKVLFTNDLSLWREQQTSDAGLFRFDMICKIKRGNNKDFWETIERHFSSKYVVFEYKNYSKKVTQKEIFTTVKYLYAKALRGVAIMISPNGVDDHADMAIRGILREEGKLIVTLTNRDLTNMLDMKKAGGEPADYLSDKLDELLIDLEK